jgi:hypothetical protein
MEKHTQKGRNGGTLNKGRSVPGPGRPPKLRALDEIGAQVLTEKVGKDGLERIEVLIRKLSDEAYKGNMQAMKILLERFYGKPRQYMEITGSDGAPIDSRIEIVFGSLPNPITDENDLPDDI